MAFTYYNPTVNSVTDLVAALVAQVPGFSVDVASIQLKFGEFSFSPAGSPGTSLSFYDGSLGLGIGQGLLLTSGDGAPPLSNTSSSYTTSFNTGFGGGSDVGDEPLIEDYPNYEEYFAALSAYYESFNSGSGFTDADLEASINAAFTGAGQIYDITSLEFTFTITDPSIRGLRFDIVFGSDEYPEFTDSSYVDIAGVYVNGANYALFNQSLTQPLSVLGTNQAAGNFRSNQSGEFPIEYDGLSSPLQVVAPVNLGQNTFKIAIADTGDSAYDSGIFVANLVPSDFAGFGLAEVITIPATSQTEPLADSLGNQIYEFLGGTNTIKIAGGNDIVKGGPGFTSVLFDFGLGDIKNYLLDGDVLLVEGPNGITSLADVARIILEDLLVAWDTQVGGKTWAASALLNAGFGALPDTSTLSKWVAEADKVESLETLSQQLIDFYAPNGVSNEDLVTLLYFNLAGVAPDASLLQQISSQIGEGQTFESQAALLAFAAQLDENLNQMQSFIGNLVVLDSGFF